MVVVKGTGILARCAAGRLAALALCEGFPMPWGSFEESEEQRGCPHDFVRVEPFDRADVLAGRVLHVAAADGPDLGAATEHASLEDLSAVDVADDGPAIRSVDFVAVHVTADVSAASRSVDRVSIDIPDSTSSSNWIHSGSLLVGKVVE